MARRPVELYPQDGNLRYREDRARQLAIQESRATSAPIEGTSDDTNAQEINRRTEEARERNLANFRERTANLESLFSPDAVPPTSNVRAVTLPGDTIGAMSAETRSSLTSLRAPGSRTTTRHGPEVVARRAAGELRRVANDRLPNIRPPTTLAVPRQNSDEYEELSGRMMANGSTLTYMNNETLPPSTPVRSALRPARADWASLTGNMARRRTYEDISLVNRYRGELTAAVRAAAAVGVNVTFDATATAARSVPPLDTPSNYSSRDSTDEGEASHTPPTVVEPAAEPVTRPSQSDFDNWYSEQDDATRELISYRDYLHYTAQPGTALGYRHYGADDHLVFGAFPARSTRHIQFNSVLRATLLGGHRDPGEYDLDPMQCTTLEEFMNTLTSEAGISSQLPVWSHVQLSLMRQTGINEASAELMTTGSTSAAAWADFWTRNFRRGRQAVIEVKVMLVGDWAW